MPKATRKTRKEIAALARMKDADIDTSGIPEITDWTRAEAGKFYRPVKQPVTVRIDADVLAWLKSQGEGYQTRINRILRTTMSPATSTESEVLTKVEQESLPPHYKDYYIAKRQNLFASIQGFSDLWECFMLLDKIWVREFEDMKAARDINRMFPLILFLNAHSKTRVALELGFSACLTEAHSILRDAIESLAHGHRLLSDPALLQTWLDKNNGDVALGAYRKEFWYEKEDRLFDGLGDLHRLWKQYSEWGSHTNINSVATRFVAQEGRTTLELRLNYTGLKPELLAPALFEMLLAVYLMEEVLYRDYSSRLQLDIELGNMRSRFHQAKEAIRRKLIVSLNILRHSTTSVGQQPG